MLGYRIVIYYKKDKNDEHEMILTTEIYERVADAIALKNTFNCYGVGVKMMLETWECNCDNDFGELDLDELLGVETLFENN